MLEYRRTYVTAIRNWMSCNFLTLNASKCKYMLVSWSRIHQYPQLYLADQPLECVQSCKYLGVTITSTLSWSDHIQSVRNKSRRLLGLLYCQFYPNADTVTLHQFYLSCIRPHLEYTFADWDPYLTKERSLLEEVQKFACKVCCKNWHMDYESMLTYLNIPSLQQRRLQLKANMMLSLCMELATSQMVHFVLVPPQDMTLETVLIFLYLLLEQMPTTTPFHIRLVSGIVSYPT